METSIEFVKNVKSMKATDFLKMTIKELSSLYNSTISSINVVEERDGFNKPELSPVKKFSDKSTAIKRIQKLLSEIELPQESVVDEEDGIEEEELEEMLLDAVVKEIKKSNSSKKSAAPKELGAGGYRKGSKYEAVCQMLGYEDGVSLMEICAITGNPSTKNAAVYISTIKKQSQAEIEKFSIGDCTRYRFAS